MHTYELRKDEGVSPVIATILMVAITVVLVGVLYLWVTSLADTGEGLAPQVTWDVSDASGYTVNGTADYDNVLLRVELGSKSFDLSKVTRWSYSVGDSSASFSVVDNGTACTQAWDAARADGSLFNGGWDNSTTCLRGNTEQDGNMDVLEYFYIIEQAHVAAVDANEDVTVTAVWEDNTQFLDEVDQVKTS